ncbi:MAG: hypothetical protein GDA56_06150 [Hormoscilla sp. GM7CHS1pb]|nr:hypothetical protein [Hormoscilla sp. GM7CHS1pb]
MLSQSSQDDRVLAQDFYRALFNLFYESCEASIQRLLKLCTFGIAPSEGGHRTFFIIAPDQELAEELVEEIDSIVNQVSRITVGVKQTAICFVPEEKQSAYRAMNYEPSQIPSNFLLGQIFDNYSWVEEDILD